MEDGPLNISSNSEEFVDATETVFEQNMSLGALSPVPRDDCVTPTPADDEWAKLNGGDRADGGLTALETEGADDFATNGQANGIGFISGRRESHEPVMQSTPVRRTPPDAGTGTLPRPTRTNVEGLPVIEPVEPMSPTDLSVASSTSVKKPRQRQQTVTMKSKLAEAIAEAFSAVKENPELANVEGAERRLQLAAVQVEKEWADKVNRTVAAALQEASKKELSVMSLVQELEESEKLFYDKCVELATNPRNGRPPLPAAFGPGAPNMSKLQSDLEAAIKQRDRMAEEFGTLENNYGDLFRRYEMLREQSQTLRDNEAKLKQEAENIAIKYGKVRTKLQEAGMAAQEALEKANEEIDRLNQARETDNLALRMKVKQYSTQIASYEATINAKNSELQELQLICDELLQKADIHD